jgi:hypothetical protein
MTVLEKKAASGVDGRKLVQYTAVAVVAGAIGVAATLGVAAIADQAELNPAQIEQVRGGLLADHLENLYIAEVNATKSADLIAFYRGPFMARVAQINEQRAADMVEHYSNVHKGWLAQINEQRAADMVELRFGASSSGR